jgi:hypothetical protein
MYAKAGLFVIGGLIAGLIVWLEQPTLKVACLLALMAWCFARAYYFAFYVIEKYVDPRYRFSGMVSFFWYVLSRKR